MTPRRFVATIKRCRPDTDLSANQLPEELRAVCARGVDDEEARRVVSKYLVANFVNDGVDALFDITDDVDALEVEAFGIHFRKGAVLPTVNASALFELKVTSAFDDVDLDEWQEENDFYFNDVVNFAWKLPVEGWDGWMTSHEGAGFGLED
jgi:hypothetical protein